MGYRGGSLASLGEEAPMLEAARRTAERVGDDLLERTKAHTPIAKPPAASVATEWLAARKRTPGTLRESWRVGRVTVIEAGHTYAIDVYTHDEIAPFVEWPTMPHIIVPRKAGGRLRFWNKLGATVYATIVHHTGTKGSYMLATALMEVAASWETVGVEEMRRWAVEQQAVIG